jgi:hypothetical protein
MLAPGMGDEDSASGAEALRDFRAEPYALREGSFVQKRWLVTTMNSWPCASLFGLAICGVGFWFGRNSGFGLGN